MFRITIKHIHGFKTTQETVQTKGEAYKIASLHSCPGIRTVTIEVDTFGSWSLVDTL